MERGKRVSGGWHVGKAPRPKEERVSERLTHDQIKKWRDSQLAEMAKNGVNRGNVLDEALFLVEEAERALAEKEIEVVIAHDVITSLRATLVEKEETCQECGLRECEHLCRQCHNARCESEVDALRATLAEKEAELRQNADSAFRVQDAALADAHARDEEIATLRATLALCQMDRTKYAERAADL